MRMITLITILMVVSSGLYACEDLLPLPSEIASFESHFKLTQSDKIVSFKEGVQIPQHYAQCTAGSKKNGYEGTVDLLTFKHNINFGIKVRDFGRIDGDRSTYESFDSLKNQLSYLERENLLFAGNGPIYMKNGRSNGYLKANGKVLNGIDCFQNRDGNLGRNNSVFLKYKPRGSSTYRWRVIQTEYLCAQLQPDAYVRHKCQYAELKTGETRNCNKGGSTRKRVETALEFIKNSRQNEDLIQADQIVFAMQGGAGVMINGKNHMGPNSEGGLYNHKDGGLRTYIGIDSQNRPVVITTRGAMGQYCLGEYLKEQHDIVSLFHRDSFASHVGEYRRLSTSDDSPYIKNGSDMGSIFYLTE